MMHSSVHFHEDWGGSLLNLGWYPFGESCSLYLMSTNIDCEHSSMHYNDVIMGAMTSEITSLMIVYAIVYSGADQRKHQSPASLAIVRGIHRWPVMTSSCVPENIELNHTLFNFSKSPHSIPSLATWEVYSKYQKRTDVHWWPSFPDIHICRTPIRSPATCLDSNIFKEKYGDDYR